MIKSFRIDSLEYDAETLSKEGKKLLAKLDFTQQALDEMANQIVLLTKAKNAYIEDLKLEVVQGRTGIELSALLSDDEI